LATVVLIQSKPRHPQSQGSVERANGDIKDMLYAWMAYNNYNTQDWSVGLRFVQYQKNSAYHSGIQRAPYKALYGTDPKVGLSPSRGPAKTTVIR